MRNDIKTAYSQQEFQNAAKIGEELLQQQKSNNNNLHYANDMYNLGTAYMELGQFDRAMELLVDSSCRMASIEGYTANYSDCLTNIAILTGRTGNHMPAYRMHKDAVDVIKNLPSRDNKLYSDKLYNLGNAASQLNRRKEALRYHFMALKLRQEIGNPEDLINSLHSIAFQYEEQNEIEPTAIYASTAANIAQYSGQGRAEAYFYLAGIYERLGAKEDALNFYEEAQQEISCSAGKSSSAYMNTAFRKADMLCKLERIEEALECQMEVTELFEKQFGKNHIFYASCLCNMAVLHKKLGNIRHAEASMLKAMKIRHGLDDIMTDIIFLIKLYLQAGEAQNALETMVYALMLHKPSDDDYSEIVANLAEIFTEEDASVSIPSVTDAMDFLNDKEKLRPIIAKWLDWEASEAD